MKEIPDFILVEVGRKFAKNTLSEFLKSKWLQFADTKPKYRTIEHILKYDLFDELIKYASINTYDAKEMRLWIG